MILKSCNNKGYNTAHIELCLDWKNRRIWVEVYQYLNGNSVHMRFPADEFGKAIDLYDELQQEVKTRS